MIEVGVSKRRNHSHSEDGGTDHHDSETLQGALTVSANMPTVVKSTLASAEYVGLLARPRPNNWGCYLQGRE